jgi:hypothetical protein
MLKPLFNKECALVGWIDPERHIFGTSLNWVAYIADGHAWCAISGNWAGPVNAGVCLDQTGRVIAWSPETSIPEPVQFVPPIKAIRAERPAKPARPTRPVRNAKPDIPVDYWSSLSFIQWVNQ